MDNKKNYKCSVKGCQVVDNKTDFVTCKGYCNKNFHGVCLNFARNWFSPVLANYFVYESCIDHQHVLQQMHDSLATKQDKLNDKYQQLTNNVAGVY